MKRILLLAAISFLFSACSNQQKEFCAQASTKLCTLCEQCGSFESCGLKHISTKTECISTFENICSAYDGVYNKEVAKTCLGSLNDLSCDQLKNSGKPEVCTRLF